VYASTAPWHARASTASGLVTPAPHRLLTVSFFFARSLLVRVTIFCASSMVSTESLRPPNQPIPVHRVDAVVSVTILMPTPAQR
jgi:hypothetical protein